VELERWYHYCTYDGRVTLRTLDLTMGWMSNPVCMATWVVIYRYDMLNFRLQVLYQGGPYTLAEGHLFSWLIWQHTTGHRAWIDPGRSAALPTSRRCGSCLDVVGS
jgi:hypothetical protein